MIKVKQHTWWPRSGRCVISGHVTQVNRQQSSHRSCPPHQHHHLVTVCQRRKPRSLADGKLYRGTRTVSSFQDLFSCANSAKICFLLSR